MSIPPQPQRTDRGRGEKAHIYMHRVMSDEMKKTNATLDDSFIPEMIQDMNRYCALLPSQKVDSDDYLNIFVLKSRDLTTKKYDPFIIQLDALESAAFPFVSGTPLSELLLKVKDSGNARATQILNATKSGFDTFIEGLDLKHQLNCINVVSQTAPVQNINLNGFIAHYRTKKENYGRFFIAFHNDSTENTFNKAVAALQDKGKTVLNEAVAALQVQGKTALDKAVVLLQDQGRTALDIAIADRNAQFLEVKDKLAQLEAADVVLRAKDNEIQALVNEGK